MELREEIKVEIKQIKSLQSKKKDFRENILDLKEEEKKVQEKLKELEKKL